MPILVQNSFPGRTTGAGLQRLRFRDDGRDDRRGALATRDGTRAEDARDRPSTQASGGNSSLTALLTRNQRAELIQQRLQASRTGQDGEETSTATGSNPGGPSGVATQQSRLPGVGTVRRNADTAVQQTGRLLPGSTNPIVNRSQNPVGRLTGAARAEAGGRANRPELPTANRPDTPPLDQGRDASIRLLAAGNNAQAAGAETERTPTAEQISRANTTEEIRTNLQTDVRAVGTELRSAAARQTRETAVRTTRAAERTGEQQQTEQVQENRSEIQDLRSQQRELERDLAQTQREIRSRENRNARLQTGTSGSSAASTLALGGRLNLLSF